MNRIGAFNPIGGMGVMMFGPTLLEYGTEAQKKRFMPGIVNGTVRWCQGYSEPGAGSDLASLRTQAVDKGDHFLVNGQKIWTSGAQFADWCFCLVRTDNTKKHEGISFVTIDMKSPGVEPRPIKLISGTSPFCETFFTDVKVPKDNLVGPLNGGWTIAKRLLQFERQNIASGGSGAAGTAAVYDLEQAALDYVGNDGGRIADRDLRARITAHKMEAPRLSDDRAARRRRSQAGQGAVGGGLGVQIRHGQDQPGAHRTPGRGARHPGPRLGRRRLQARTRSRRCGPCCAPRAIPSKAARRR